MQKRRAFEPGDTVKTFTGQVGMVVAPEVFSEIRGRLKEGRRPGRYFAPGCCLHPDYVVQVPVLFEEGTYDVMRAMNLRKTSGISPEMRTRIQQIVEGPGATTP